MRAYLLITTSGIMFFIISAVTIIHLMASRSLNQQYLIHSNYQDFLNRLSIQQIVTYLVDNNIQYIQLPDELNSEYSLSNYNQLNGSVDFVVENNLTEKRSSFNIQITDSMARNIVQTNQNIFVDGSTIKDIELSSSTTVHLVALRSVWYPYTMNDRLTYYSFTEENDEDFVTANVSMGQEIVLNSPRSDSNFNMNLYFSSLPQPGIVSLYLRYSDGSIKNVQIEL